MRGFLLLLTQEDKPHLQLTGINKPGGEEITYQYDSRGNRIQANAYEIDPSEFVLSEYEYNTWDELSEVRINGNTYSFEYDPEGLRTVKETSEESIRYHCDDNGLVIAESDETDTVTAQNIWGHKPLARKIDGSYYYYIYNGHGDVIQVLDESGNAVNSYEYDEWGNILSQQETVDNPLKYCGEYYDDESGLYYLRARYYDPVLGKFISKDPVEGDITNPLTLNRYAYCVGSPIIYYDHNGFWEAQVHYDLTYQWAIDGGITEQYARAMALGSKNIDITASALPVIGNQSVHFDRNPNPNIDTRQQLFDAQLEWAIEYSNNIEAAYQNKLQIADGKPWYAIAKAKAEWEREKAIWNLCYHFGEGLHSIQDMDAHMDWAEGDWFVPIHKTTNKSVSFDDPRYDLIKVGNNKYEPVDSGRDTGSQRYRNSQDKTRACIQSFISSISSIISRILLGGGAR